MALIPTQKGFDLNGRFYHRGVALSDDVAAIVRQPQNANLLALCVSTPEIASAAPEPQLAAPPADLEN